jgi:hypothetical protein
MVRTRKENLRAPRFGQYRVIGKFTPVVHAVKAPEAV